MPVNLAFSVIFVLLGMLVWLSVWSKMQVIARGPADATATPSSLGLLKSRMVLPVWYQLTMVVVKKKLLNGCSSSFLF